MPQGTRPSLQASTAASLRAGRAPAPSAPAASTGAWARAFTWAAVCPHRCAPACPWAAGRLQLYVLHLHRRPLAAGTSFWIAIRSAFSALVATGCRHEFLDGRLEEPSLRKAADEEVRNQLLLVAAAAAAAECCCCTFVSVIDGTVLRHSTHGAAAGVGQLATPLCPLASSLHPLEAGPSPAPLCSGHKPCRRAWCVSCSRCGCQTLSPSRTPASGCWAVAGGADGDDGTRCRRRAAAAAGWC